VHGGAQVAVGASSSSSPILITKVPGRGGTSIQLAGFRLADPLGVLQQQVISSESLWAPLPAYRRAGVTAAATPGRDELHQVVGSSRTEARARSRFDRAPCEGAQYADEHLMAAVCQRSTAAELRMWPAIDFGPAASPMRESLPPRRSAGRSRRCSICSRQSAGGVRSAATRFVATKCGEFTISIASLSGRGSEKNRRRNP